MRAVERTVRIELTCAPCAGMCGRPSRGPRVGTCVGQPHAVPIMAALVALSCAPDPARHVAHDAEHHPGLASNGGSMCNRARRKNRRARRRICAQTTPPGCARLASTPPLEVFATSEASAVSTSQRQARAVVRRRAPRGFALASAAPCPARVRARSSDDKNLRRAQPPRPFAPSRKLSRARVRRDEQQTSTAERGDRPKGPER